MIDLKKRYEVLMDKNKRLSFRISELEEENFKLKKNLSLEKEDHQYDNLIHAKEIKEIRKGKKK